MKKLIEPYAGGVVIDIGTGDGRFVSVSAKTNPDKFFIGIDANVKPLEKPSMRVTRKPSKGGLPNTLFVQAAVEDLPEELNGIADNMHVNFPWGSLLKAVATGDATILRALHRISEPECLLEIVIGIDPERDRSEIERLGLSDMTEDSVGNVLIPRYLSAGFECSEYHRLDSYEYRQIETSWARKLQGRGGRVATRLIFKAVRSF